MSDIRKTKRRNTYIKLIYQRFFCHFEKICCHKCFVYLVSTKQNGVMLILEPVGALNISGGAHPLPPPRWQGGPEGGL